MHLSIVVPVPGSHKGLQGNSNLPPPPLVGFLGLYKHLGGLLLLQGVKSPPCLHMAHTRGRSLALTGALINNPAIRRPPPCTIIQWYMDT